jgi:hypothetical protein
MYLTRKIYLKFQVWRPLVGKPLYKKSRNHHQLIFFVDLVKISHFRKNFFTDTSPLKGLRWISPKLYFYSKKYDSKYKQERRNKTKAYLNIVKVAIPNIFSLGFQKNKFEKFWTRNREIFRYISK